MLDSEDQGRKRWLAFYFGPRDFNLSHVFFCIFVFFSATLVCDSSIARLFKVKITTLDLSLHIIIYVIIHILQRKSA